MRPLWLLRMLKEETMELLYFTAKWCVPCRSFGPVMERVTEPAVTKVDVDLNTEMVNLYGVMSVPTVILAKDGFEVARFSGARDLDYVNKFVASHS